MHVNAGASILTSEVDVITVETLLIGGSICRDINLTGDDRFHIKLETLIQGGLCIKEASEKLEECSEEQLRNAQAVIIHVGSCDFPVRDIRELDDNYRNYVELLTSVTDSCPEAQLVIASILPRSGKGQSQVNEQIRDFNSKLAKLSENEDKIMFVDTVLHFEDEKGVIDSLYKRKDKSGIHVNTDGRKRLEASLQEAVKETVFKRKLEAECI